MKNPIIFNTALDIYTATDIIGEGGSSRIYMAKDTAGDTVAIKLLNPAKLTTENKKRFKNEVLFSFKNKHPNIVTIIDYGNVLDKGQNVPFCVMPHFSSSLRTLIQSGISPDDVLPLFSQILNGVEAAHLLNVVHRDIKPENILYDKNTKRLVIADFGIAQFKEEELYTAVKTADNKRLANFIYAAPEQRIRGQQVDRRADIFALGLILNEMFTKQVIQGASPKTIGRVSKKHSYLDELVDEMRKQAPEERPTSIDIIKSELTSRGNEFITSQKISQLSNTVIPASDIDDPIIKDPIKLVGVDWDNNVLTLILNLPTNPLWTTALYNMGRYTSMMGKEPAAFKFIGNKATISATEHEVQQIVNYFKEWLPNANAEYKRYLENAQREKEEETRRQIEREKKVQEARQRVLRDTKI